MSGPKCRTGQQPRPRPLVPQETSIRLWSPAAREDRRGECVSGPARAPSLSHHAPPTHTNRVLGPVTLQTEVTEGRTGGHPQLFQGFEPPRHRAWQPRGMHPHKSTEKRGRKEHLPVMRLPWQRAAPGGKWWRPALAPGGRDTASRTEAPIRCGASPSRRSARVAVAV